MTLTSLYEQPQVEVSRSLSADGHDLVAEGGHRRERRRRRNAPASVPRRADGAAGAAAAQEHHLRGGVRRSVPGRGARGEKTHNQPKEHLISTLLFKPLQEYGKGGGLRVLAIRREDQSVWERRAPLAPAHVAQLVKRGVKVIVQPSNRRAYPVGAYRKAGAVISEDLSEASVIMGVKQARSIGVSHKKY